MTGSGSAERPLRIVLVVGSLRIGGTETQLVKLAADLRARGHEVHVVAVSRGGPLEAELRAQGTPVRIFGHSGLRLRDDTGWRPPRALLGEAREVLAIWRHLRSLRADVCHAFGFTCYTLVLPLAWAAGVPIRVNGRRGMPPATPTGLRRRLRDLLGHLCSSVYVCNSHAGARDLEAREGVPAARIVVIPNGVGIPASAAEAGRQPPRGVVVANLLSYKGHADLVAALGMLTAPPGMCFVGEGPERERLTALVEERGLERVVAFAGMVPVADRLLRHYQFAVLPSHEEGLPNAVLEAMAAGLPVIATAVGGTPEIVVDGVTGLLVPPHAPHELAGAIARLAGDPRLRAEMGAAARRAAQALSIGSCATRHETVYRTAPR